MTHLSLFSGIGGLDIAAQWAGFRTVGLCEYADYPYMVLQKRFPGVPIWRDIRTLTGEDFYEQTGRRTVDVVSGGFPCQPFSVAGKRLGKDDDRYLWPEMCRVISEIRPAWVVGENVAGIVSMVEPVGEPELVRAELTIRTDSEVRVYDQRKRYVLAGIVEDLERIGYAVQPFIIPAAGVGANHRRERVAIIAHAARELLDRRFPRAEPPGIARFADGGTDVSDPRRAGREKLHLAAVANRQGYPSGPDASGRAERPAQPRLGRMDDGIPARLDGCGRAIRNPAAQSAVVGHRAYDPDGGGGNPAPGRSAEMPGKRGSPRAVLPDFCGDCGGNGGRQK